MKFSKRLSSVVAKVLPNKTADQKSEQAEIQLVLADVRAKAFFALLFVVLGVFLLVCLKPYFDAIVLATLTAIVLFPLYQRLQRKTGWSQRIVTTLVMALLGIGFILLTLFILQGLFREAKSVQGALNDFINSGGASKLAAEIQSALAAIGIHVTLPDSGQLINTILESLNQSLLSLIGTVVSGISTFIISSSIYIFLLFYLLPRVERIKNFLVEVAPLGKDVTHDYLKRVQLLLRGTILGTFLVSMSCAIIMGLAFWALGIPNAMFFASLAFILGCIPYLGTYLFTCTAAFLYLISGNYGPAIFLLLLQVLVLNQVDLIFRPIALPKQIRINPALNVIAVMSGLAAFGIIGIVYGPLIFILFISSVQIYRQNFVDTPKTT